MGIVKLDEVIECFDKIKLLANEYFLKEDFKKSLKYISAAAVIGYKFNWIYSDEYLENLLIQISTRLIEQKDYQPQKDKIVFFDSFCLENRGLTQQYIRAFMSWEMDLLYIFEGGKVNSSNKIIEELKEYPKAKIINGAGLSDVEKIKYFYNEIVDFQAERAFLHISPSSVIAVVVFNALPKTIRYQVNLTDHAFWLGTSCIDYCLEFRNYGYTVSVEKRGLSNEQCLLQPYYPITDCKPFQGFPSQVKEDSVVIFTGGAYYKMYGENDTFFKIIKSLIDINEKVIVLIAGSGDSKPIHSFINNNSFEDRVLLIGSRPDINYVFKECDIYLSTFPITGGLMGQFAAINKKPILSYTLKNIQCNFTEGFLNWKNSKWKVTQTNMKSFLIEANGLINNLEYRHKRGIDTFENLITFKEFNNHLKKLIKNNVNSVKFINKEIDYNKFSKLYIDCENNYLPSFYSFILSRFKINTLLLFPKIFVKAISSKSVINKLSTVFLRMFKTN